ncbi:hypothetical protein H0H87_007391 [Tephrocybe sp. NHM501043]|nr:hypothetical protein H0H87_007391 [Tephrocybe sp. NHM501043]
MNAAWIDYLQVEQPASVAPGLIAGIVIGGIVGLLLLVIIGVLLRRISRLSRRQVQYEKVPRKATQTYWPWMSRPPGDVTPFSNDPLSESQPLAARPFLLNSSNYPPQPRESLQHPALDLGTSISGYTTRGGSFADKPSPTASSSRYSHTSGHTSRSGYTTQGGTFADKMPSPTTTTSTTTISTNRTSNSSYNGYNVQGSTLADKVNRHSQPTSTNPARLNNSEHLSPTSDTLELVPRPFLTNRVTDLKMARETIIIDDASPRIVYTGFWERAGRFEEYKATTHGTSGAGARATFTFNGSSIAVFGTIGRENNNGDPLFAPITTYSLDGGVAVPFTHTPNYGIVFRQMFFQAQDLEEKEHTLVIENTVSGKNMVWLDYLQLVSNTERPEDLSPAYSPSNGAELGGRQEFFRGMVTGSAVTILIFVCLFMVALRRVKRKLRRDGDLDAPNFRDFIRNRRRHRSGSSAYDEQLALQVGLLGEEPHAPLKAPLINAPRHDTDLRRATTSSTQGLHGTQSYKRVVPVDPQDSPMDSQESTMVATSSLRTEDQDDIPPAYGS